MNPLLRKTLRTIKENKVQYLGAFIMVMISSMMLVGMTLVSSNLAAIFTAFSSNHRLADAEFSAPVALDIASLETRFDAAIEMSSLVDYELQPGQTLRILSENTTNNRHAVVHGGDLSGREILLDPLFAAANDLKTGSSLNIGGSDYVISGHMALPNYIYIIRSKEEMINDPKTFGIAVLPRQYLEGLPGRSDYYTVRFHQRENIHEQELLFRDFLANSGVNLTYWESTENNSRVSFVTLEITTLSTMSKALPGMLLALSMILVAILLKRMIQQEAAVLGTLYASGYRRAELARHYLAFPLLVGGAGGLLGAVLGIAMVKPMLDFMMTVFNMPVISYRYDYRLFLIGMLLPVTLLCLASYFVVARLLAASPAELMKGARVSEKLNFIERTLKLERFNFSTRFQIREQVRSLSRTSFLLLGVIVATMLLLYGLTLQSSLDYMLTEGIAALYNLKYEYVYHDLQYETPPSGTEQFNAIYVTPQNDRTFNFAIVGALPDSTRLRLKDSSGARLVPDRVIVTKMLADRLRLGKGDTLTVISDENLREYTFIIEAVADSAAGEFMFMPLESMNAMVGAPAGAYIGIWGDEPLVFPEGTIRSTKSMDAIEAGIRNLISQTGILVYTLTVSAFVLGLVIIFLVTGMVIEENRNTISLLKVLGYRPKEVNRLILDSHTLVVIAGYLIGIPVLLVSVSALMQSLADSMQMTIPARLNTWYMLFGFVIVMLTYQAAKLLSKKKIDRIAMSEALKAGTE